MSLPIKFQQDPFLDIHTGSQGSCTFAREHDCNCACAGTAHAQLLRMMITPRDIGTAPEKYQIEYQKKRNRAASAINTLPPSSKELKNSKKYYIDSTIASAITDYCTTISIYDYLRADDKAIDASHNFCETVSRVAIQHYQSLDHDAGVYLSKAHVLCDILCSILQTLNQVNKNDSALVISQCITTFNRSRENSYGFPPSQKRRSNTIIKHAKSRKNIDESWYKVGGNHSCTLPKNLYIELIKEISADVLEYYNTSAISSHFALICSTLLFCNAPERHKAVWNSCLIPIFFSDACSQLRKSIPPDTLEAMRLARNDSWDKGAASSWIQ